MMDNEIRLETLRLAFATNKDNLNLEQNLIVAKVMFNFVKSGEIPANSDIQGDINQHRSNSQR